MEIRDVLTNIKKYDAWDYKNYPLRKEEADAIIENYKEPCEDCISRKAVLNCIEAYCNDLSNEIGMHIRTNELLDTIRQLPSVNPQPKTDVLDKIRAEIEKLRPHNLRPEQMTDYDYAMADVFYDIVTIIDKYRKER